MIILHTGDKRLILMTFANMLEAKNALLAYQEKIKKEFKFLNIPFEKTKEYVEKYNKMVKDCNHKETCDCYEAFYEANGNIDYNDIVINVPHPLYDKKLSVEEALTIFFLSTVLEEKEVLRINNKIVHMSPKETITAKFISDKIDELLASNIVIETITVNDKDVNKLTYNLHLNYPMSKSEAMDLVKIPQSNLTICEFVRKQNPIVKDALYATANRVFFRAVDVAFKLVDAMNAANKI